MVNIDLRITTTAAERQAWQTLRPKLKEYLGGVLRLYRNANPQQKLLLREHCQILDSVLDMLGE